MSRREESPAEFLVKAPWQVSVVLSVGALVLMLGVFPAIFARNQVTSGLAVLLMSFAPFVAGFFLLLAGLSALFAWRRRRLVDSQNSLESFRALSPKEFEWMVGEAYRRQGFSVEESIRDGPDGGIDVVLRRDGRTTLVQCKRWRVLSVGVPVVREIFGVMTAERADSAIVVTSGRFTQEAKAFAQNNAVELIDGPQLLELVRGVQQRGAGQATPPIVPATLDTKPACPKCGAEMVLRTAKRGAHAGNSFWGCPNYPKCTGIRQMP
jgi:restriction system protein